MPIQVKCGKEGVSDAIRHYIRKGKPQKQAVAIALDMQRRECGGAPKAKATKGKR